MGDNLAHVDVIQKYLPQEAQADHLRELEIKGTVYGKHFSLQSLIHALQWYVSSTGKIWPYDHRAEQDSLV